MATIKPRMANPVIVVPGALDSLLGLSAIAKSGKVPEKTITLIHLRASQINGCSLCVDMHAKELKKLGETDERLFAVAAWHEAPYFTDAERGALALTEAATRLSDRSEPVTDEIWNQAARHYDESQLAIIVLNIGLINLWNRINATTRQLAGTVKV